MVLHLNTYKPLLFKAIMLNLKKCEEEQRKLSSKVILKDEFKEILTVGGAEAYIVNGKMVACVVVCDMKTLEVRERSIAKGEVESKFHPEFRTYREGRLLGEAFASLSHKPDIILIGGDGILHPRGIGLASHLGVLLDIPTVGLLKEKLFGEAKGNFLFFGSEKRGMLVKTHEHANPIVVSPGHKISLESAASLVKRCLREPHKMPEPLHLAHKFAKQGMKETDSHP